jgi:hypothetical protein
MACPEVWDVSASEDLKSAHEKEEWGQPSVLHLLRTTFHTFYHLELVRTHETAMATIICADYHLLF